MYRITCLGPYYFYYILFQLDLQIIKYLLFSIVITIFIIKQRLDVENMHNNEMLGL